MTVFAYRLFWFIIYFVSSKYDFNVYQRALVHYVAMEWRMLTIFVLYRFINPYQNALHAVVPIDTVNL